MQRLFYISPLTELWDIRIERHFMDSIVASGQNVTFEDESDFDTMFGS